MEKKEEKNKKQALNLEELDKVSGGISVIALAFICPECFKQFHTKEEANQHLKDVHGYKEDFFK